MTQCFDVSPADRPPLLPGRNQRWASASLESNGRASHVWNHRIHWTDRTRRRSCWRVCDGWNIAATIRRGWPSIDEQGAVSVRRAEGKLDNLAQCVAAMPPQGSAGMGHTRWATHGVPCERNAHPHSSPDGQIFVVQNGIVENFRALRAELTADGYTFASDTDTEVIAHLVHRYYNNGCGEDLAWAVRSALARLEGPSAIVAMSRDCPRLLVAARLGNAGGVAVGVRDGEAFLASDVPAIVGHVDEVVHLDSGQIAVVEPDGAQLSTCKARRCRASRCRSRGTRSRRKRAATSSSWRRRSTSRGAA